MKNKKPNFGLILTLLLSFVLIIIFLKKPLETKEQLLGTGCNVMNELGFGSGNFINNRTNPYVLTCKHVIKPNGIDGGKIFIGTASDDKVDICDGKLVILSKTLDFAIIEVEKIPISSNIARYSHGTTRIGDEAFYFGLIGRPGAMFFCKGYVAQKRMLTGENEEYDSLYSNTIGGSSGSTIFNSKNQGIGIICKANKDHTHSYYLPIEQIRNKLINSGLKDISGILEGTSLKRISTLHNGPIELP